MKKLYFLLLLIFGYASAQIPSGYYNSATGTGYTLKTQLHNIIKNYDPQPYNSIDDFFPGADRDQYYENNNTILDPYSENPAGPDPYNYSVIGDGDQCGNYDSEGDCYNAEHVIPQSVFGQAEPMRGDAHHLLPTDGRVNGFRSNHPFGVAGTLVTQSGISNPTMNGSKLGFNINTGYAAGYSQLVFEPIDEFKGDIARIYFYFVTRYQNVMGGWNYPMFDGTSTKSIADPFLLILLNWHANDPVSQKEIDRNNEIYTYQENRNPFVDHPEYACMIWSMECALSTADLVAGNIVVYPIPSKNNQIHIKSDDAIQSIKISSINGQIVQRISAPIAVDGIYSIDGLQSGMYFLTAVTADASVTKKIIIE